MAKIDDVTVKIIADTREFDAAVARALRLLRRRSRRPSWEWYAAWVGGGFIGGLIGAILG